jgi:hypothetical protein
MPSSFAVCFPVEQGTIKEEVARKKEENER